MAISLGINAKNDLYLLPNGNLAVATGVNAVLQDCKNAMQAQLGEMILQINKGMPMFDTVWLSLNIEQFKNFGRQTLLSVPNVTEVASFTAQVVGSVLTYQATIVTIYGTGVING